MRFLGRTRHQNRFYQRRDLEVVLVPILISSLFKDVPPALVEETDTEDKEDRSTMGYGKGQLYKTSMPSSYRIQSQSEQQLLYRWIKIKLVYYTEQIVARP